MSAARAVYFVNGSISSWRVLIAAREKGLAFEPRRLRVMREPRETRTPEFLALNPRGQAPVLVEPDGTAMNESLAILTYLEMRYPDPPLLPPLAEPGALALALALAQESEATACVYDPLESLFEAGAGPLSPDRRAAVLGALSGVERELALWEARAQKARFIASDAFTLADCSFYPVLAYMQRRGLSLAGHPALDAYERRVRSRPSAVASYPEGWSHGQARPDLFAQARALAAPTDGERLG
ncbi:glutathione S-transferase family protein [Sorangium sp. So ce406]|uniref:glutathione S-transferase family protein n=1 Tax=Sorangium sp. So ce406 TaxID=3133311 RepID=UPI003F5BC1C6